MEARLRCTIGYTNICNDCVSFPASKCYPIQLSVIWKCSRAAPRSLPSPDHPEPTGVMLWLSWCHCLIFSRELTGDRCLCSCDSRPAILPRAGHSNQGRAIIPRVGGGRSGAFGADPRGRYIYLGNESPNTAPLRGGSGTRPIAPRDPPVPWQRSPRAAH